MRGLRSEREEEASWRRVGAARVPPPGSGRRRAATPAHQGAGKSCFPNRPFPRSTSGACREQPSSLRRNSGKKLDTQRTKLSAVQSKERV